ncbi:D-aminopeptidase [Lichenifustis flavocetrariae]|uniref:D-aminopeptidase n=1 Tax=Lichenifustis flavocetrariae TaxID=2949735 RepID=A0AA42CN73_9HYPH|nr:D-aminopeptidase [Lichenifustis flavocetrariae]MCW6509095.1 D-aminopeptidase [Lichenifustis flavocetrariae]
MTKLDNARLDRVLQALPRTYAGPGGAVAVLREGEVLVRHAWGFANAERRTAFTPQTLFRMCSITKQFTCGLVLDAFPDPSVLDSDVGARLPHLRQPAPDFLHLCHNQSGLRDYWAVAMLQGSPVEAPFGDAEAMRLIRGTQTLQFAPGTRYSYCNNNFRIVSDILETRTGRSFAELLRTRMFEPAGMSTAFLAADTRAMPDGTEGYEGNQAIGFRAAENRIIWTGDAGIGASLDDMIAWEQFIDSTRDDSHGVYAGLAAPVRFADGAEAAYGFGLSRRPEFGRLVVGHAGALRGWRSQRIFVPSERISVVVLFNHLADPHAAALELLGAMLGEDHPAPDRTMPWPDWVGTYVEPETGLAVRIEPARAGEVRLRYGQTPERLNLSADGTAGDIGTRLVSRGDGLWMHRPQDNQSSMLRPCSGQLSLDVAGRFHCEEIDADLSVVDGGGALYGGFSGLLGQGRMELLDPIGPDLWALPCPRALDHTPPGDWTLAFRRDGAGKVDHVNVGCWLARGLSYARVG